MRARSWCVWLTSTACSLQLILLSPLLLCFLFSSFAVDILLRFHQDVDKCCDASKSSSFVSMLCACAHVYVYVSAYSHGYMWMYMYLSMCEAD